MGKHQRRKWEEMQSDCLVLIFSKLGLDDLTLGIPIVCKSWREASLDPQCWRYLDFRELDFGAGGRLAGRFKREYAVESFSFSGFMKLCLSRSRRSAVELAIPFIPGASLRQDLLSASVEWKLMEILEMTWKPSCFVEILEEIGGNCPSFLGLHLCGAFESSEATALARCLPGLRILVMSASFLPREALMAILEGCRELEVLDVSRCRGFRAEDREVLRKASGIGWFECRGSEVEDDRLNVHYAHDDATRRWLISD
ncbi:F-box/LRR-repeat protein [Apostasia shenzhenica]|uniref:F-box/LRR-repeat protein n=1 Tax=Apostasia shenzhenica TaxID=1088818 RepID=A0A2I0B2E2_9ASPA|nr:F-box/LRR-repeat protein [Apostasia shenzhenica]